MEGSSEKLGIFVTTPSAVDKLIKLVEAAKRAGKEVMVFLTFKGVHAVSFPEFKRLLELLGEEQLGVCETSLICEGYDPGLLEVPRRCLRTQAFHGTIVNECKKYIVL